MTTTIVGLITPHLLRVIDFANEAEKGVNVDWHVRDAVSRTMDELGNQFNAPVLVTAYIDGLEAAAGQAPKTRPAYMRVLQVAIIAARNPA
ncbi:MAG: hypothetical protein EPO46_04650 [Lysobacter sp.]|nr:MAG: hypothetical protein EPO46_04650 [Lysobacter sp.]